MAGFRDFREMAAWQLSRDVRTLAYRLLAKREVARDFEFRDQLKDAARSAPRNIAEGFARCRVRNARTRVQEGAQSNQRIDSLLGINSRSAAKKSEEAK